MYNDHISLHGRRPLAQTVPDDYYVYEDNDHSDSFYSFTRPQEEGLKCKDSDSSSFPLPHNSPIGLGVDLKEWDTQSLTKGLDQIPQLCLKLQEYADAQAEQHATPSVLNPEQGKMALKCLQNNDQGRAYNEKVKRQRRKLNTELTDKDRQLKKLKEDDGLSWADIGERMGTSKSVAALQVLLGYEKTVTRDGTG